ncbi:hypothetical protein OSK99_11125, partial [Escherichia coli]|nr:hypothetical protein [Escherichia coli]
DKGWDARKRAYCLKIQPATGSFARNIIYSTKPPDSQTIKKDSPCGGSCNVKYIPEKKGK